MSTERLDDLIETDATDKQNSAVERLVIIGGGTMGRGISIVAARRGVNVLLIEKNERTLENSLKKVSDDLDHEITRWAMTESEKNAIMSHITGVIEFSEISDQEYIIEALPENLKLKMDIFLELEKYCSPEAIFITNTSTLSITELASATDRPDRMIGMHFLYPVSKIKLIELVKALVREQGMVGLLVSHQPRDALRDEQLGRSVEPRRN